MKVETGVKNGEGTVAAGAGNNWDFAIDDLEI